MSYSSTSTGSRSSGTRQLVLGPALTLGLKLYVTADDEKGTGLHKGCPECLSLVAQPPTCPNEACDETVLESTVQVYGDESPMLIEDTDLDSMDMPDKKFFVVAGRIPNKEAAQQLSSARSKYFLLPDGKGNVTAYAALAHALLTRKQSLLVKFALKSRRQKLGMLMAEEGCLVIAVIPYAAELRETPTVDMPAALPSHYVKSMLTAFDEVPETRYDAAVDVYDSELSKLVTGKIVEAAKPTKGRKSAAAKPIKALSKVFTPIKSLGLVGVK